MLIIKSVPPVLGFRLLLTAAAVSLFGCGGSDRPKTIPITGRVTINGQPPGEFGRMHFQPTQPAEGYATRPASGSYTVEGDYRVMSWEADDGLVPGHYTVSLAPSDPKATKIPAKYHDSGKSGFEVDVPIDTDEIQFDIDVKTP